MSQIAATFRTARIPDARRRQTLAVGAVAAIVAAVFLYGMFTTVGYLTVSNLKAILTSSAFVGIIAVGMTVIMLSGNLFSLSLGTTAAVTAMMFLYALTFGLAVAIVLTVVLGAAIVGLQGLLVGAWGANPIIVTIGAGGVQAGIALWVTGGQSILPPESATSYLHLALPLLGVPFGIYVFLAVAVVVHVVLRFTRFGRELMLMGANRPAARAVGLPVVRLTTGAFAIAGACTGIAGMLIGATSANGSLLLESTYTYDAIAAALVGGTAVTGGKGSVLRTVFGAIFIAAISDMLLLRGYSTGVQILVKGLTVLVVVSLMNLNKLWNR
jgi:ribose/xylose/arabinose/galactoside ABC-type transport system permease subunit